MRSEEVRAKNVFSIGSLLVSLLGKSGIEPPLQGSNPTHQGSKPRTRRDRHPPRVRTLLIRDRNPLGGIETLGPPLTRGRLSGSLDDPGSKPPHPGLGGIETQRDRNPASSGIDTPSGIEPSASIGPSTRRDRNPHQGSKP